MGFIFAYNSNSILLGFDKYEAGKSSRSGWLTGHRSSTLEINHMNIQSKALGIWSHLMANIMKESGQMGKICTLSKRLDSFFIYSSCGLWKSPPRQNLISVPHKFEVTWTLSSALWHRKQREKERSTFSLQEKDVGVSVRLTVLRLVKYWKVYALSW